jgi:hypothetical protein
MRGFIGENAYFRAKKRPLLEGGPKNSRGLERAASIHVCRPLGINSFRPVDSQSNQDFPVTYNLNTILLSAILRAQPNSLFLDVGLEKPVLWPAKGWDLPILPPGLWMICLPIPSLKGSERQPQFACRQRSPTPGYSLVFRIIRQVGWIVRPNMRVPGNINEESSKFFYTFSHNNLHQKTRLHFCGLSFKSCMYIQL